MLISKLKPVNADLKKQKNKHGQAICPRFFYLFFLIFMLLS